MKENKTREQLNVEETSFEIRIDKSSIFVTEHAIDKYREFSKYYLGRTLSFTRARRTLTEMVFNARPHDIIVRQHYNGNTILLLPHTDEHLILNLDPHRKYKEEGITIQVLTHVSRSRNRFIIDERQLSKQVTDEDIQDFREEIEDTSAYDTFVEMMSKPKKEVVEVMFEQRDWETIPEKQPEEHSLYGPTPYCGRCHKPIKQTRKQKEAFVIHGRCLSCVGKKNAYAPHPRKEK